MMRHGLVRPGAGCACALTLALGISATAHAQYSAYRIHRVGLYEPEHPLDGPVYNGVNELWPAMRMVRGTWLSEVNGSRVWIWSPTLGGTVQLGFTGPGYIGDQGYQSSSVATSNDAGMALGDTDRITGTKVNNGEDAWIWSPSLGTIQVGLLGTDYEGSGGYRVSSAIRLTESGQVAGISYRVIGVKTSNGRDAWVWDQVNGTRQIGLLGPQYTGTGQFRRSEVNYHNQAGHVAGYTERYSGASTNGRNYWIYDPTTNTTTPVGLLDSAHTGPNGYQNASHGWLSDAGQVVGISTRLTTTGFDNGSNAWAYDPVLGITKTIGLTTPANTGSAGYQSVTLSYMNDEGYVCGYSPRYTGVSTANGTDVWAYDPVAGQTVAIGLTGPEYTGSGGYHSDYVRPFFAASGHATGYTHRITGVNTHTGHHAWIWSPTTGTVQLGLTGPEYTGSVGFVESFCITTDTGLVRGSSNRITGVNTNNGQNPWVWTEETGCVQIGLVEPAHIGSAGYQYISTQEANLAGQIAGYSYRITGVNTQDGRNTWVWNQALGTTMKIGLTGPEHTGPADHQWSTFVFEAQNQAGQIVGTSTRYTAAGESGSNIWVWEPATQTTIITGLTDAVHTSSTGVQLGVTATTRNEAAQVVVGYSYRYDGTTQIGRDAWYYDPATGLTHQPTLGAPDAVRTADNYAYSTPSIVTDDGYLFGLYTHFPGGLAASAQDRVFVFRPDVGFADLGELVQGGLTARGWQVLEDIAARATIDFIAGLGLLVDQTDGSSAFVLVPPPLCPGDITGDGFTNASDFNILAAHFGQSVLPYFDGDLNGDGDVNTQDFNILAGDFGCVPD